MRFSLLSIILVITLSSFGIWIYQLNLSIESTIAESQQRRLELSNVDQNLERDVELLRVGAQPNQSKLAVVDKLEAFFQSHLQRLRLDSNFSSEELVVRQIPSINFRDPLEYQIYVPKGRKAVWRVEAVDNLGDETREAIASQIYDFSQPIEIFLPPGLSKMKVVSDNSQRPLFRVEFVLNEVVQASAGLTVPPVGESNEIEFTIDLIRSQLVRHEATAGGGKPVLVAKRILKERHENFDDFYPEIGFMCVVELMEPDAGIGDE